MNGAPFLCHSAAIGGEEGVCEALVDIFHCLLARMQHIWLIETIVAKLIIDYLISWKILHFCFAFN